MLDAYHVESTKFTTSNGELIKLELKDQFVCRAWYAQAQVRALASKGQKGQELVKGVLDSLTCLLQGLEVALEDPRYKFLVLDASIHYANISRPIQRAGLRRHLVESSAVIAKGLETFPGQEVWRAHILRLHSLCLSDADRNDEALQAAANAHELCKDAFPELARQMTKLKSHIAAISGNKDAGDGVQGALALTQYVRSGGCKDAEEAESTLKDAWSKVDSASELCGEAIDQPSEGVDMEAVAEIAWVAAQNQLLDLAGWCLKRASTKSTPLIRARCSIASLLISLNALGEAQGTLDPSAIEVHKGIVNRAEEEVTAFLRLQDKSGVQDACQLIWRASFPLLQPNLRHNLTRVFAEATDALESIGSTLHRLRAALHLELAYCYVADDMIPQAHANISKALALDYTSSDAEVERTGYDRPLDRYLEQMDRVLTLKNSAYDAPDSIEDRVLLLAEQARDAKTAKMKAELLHAAYEKLSSLDPLMPYPDSKSGADQDTDTDANDGGEVKPDEDAPDKAIDITSEGSSAGDIAGTLTSRKLAALRLNIWRTVIEVAAEAKMMSVVHQAAPNVTSITGWDTVRDKESIIIQIEVNFLHALACMHMLKKTGVELVPPRLVDVYETRAGDSVYELQNNSIAALLRAMNLGASINESWAVMNAATYVWNNYIHLVKKHRYEELLPATAPLLAELCKLDNCEPLLLGNIAHVVASGHEHVALIAATKSSGDAIPDEKEAADGAGEEKATDISAETQEDEVLDYKYLRDKFASHSFEDSEDVKKGIETCESALGRVDELNTRRLSEMIARLQASLGGSPDVKVEDDVVAVVSGMIPQIVHPGKDVKEAGDILGQAMALLRPEGGDISGDVEIWARLGEAALCIKSFGLAIECCKQAAVLSVVLDKRAPPRSWYWSGVAECAYGSAIIGLIRPEQQEDTTQDALKQKSFEHFIEAAKHGRRANRRDIVGYASKCFWNAATSFMSSAATRKVLSKPLEIFLEAARATKYDDFKFMQSLYLLLFDCLVDACAWEDGARQVNAAFKALPSSEHKPLWEYRVMFLSTLGRSVDEEIGIISSYDEEMQAKVWAGLASQASVPFDAMRAHRQAIKILEHVPAQQVDYMVDFAEWLYANGQPVTDAEDLLLSALEILLGIDNAPSKEDALVGEDSMVSFGSFKSELPHEIPPRFGVKHMVSTIRVFLVLSKISGNTVERNEHLLMAQHYALRMLRESIVEASKNTAVPDALEDWAKFEFSDELLSLIQENDAGFKISIDSVGRPELFHAFVEYMCSELESSGMHLQCLPVCQLGMLVSKLAADNDQLVTIYHLKLAVLSDALFLSSACALHEDLAGPLELSAEELARGRLEVKRAMLLKPNDISNMPEDFSTTEASHKLLRPFTLRDYWLARGAYLAKRGAISSATALLQETIGHAQAHDDAETEAKAYFHLAKCASFGNRTVDAIKLQHCAQMCGGDVSFWGENLADYTKYKLSTRDGQLSAKDSLTAALKLMQSRLLFAGQGSALEIKEVIANLLVELCHVLEVEMRGMRELGEHPETQYIDALHAISEAVVIMQDSGGGMNMVNALMSQAMLMYKDPSAKGDPRPALENIKRTILDAEVEAERILATACAGTLKPLAASLPAARLLAAVKNAKANCLLEIAYADKTLEKYDKEQSRPAFPTLEGNDPTAVLAFLDDSAPKTFKRSLAAAEEAVVVASEAANLHRRSDGTVESLRLLGEALLAVHDAQTNPTLWTEPEFISPVPTAPLALAEGNVAEENGNNEDVAGEDPGDADAEENVTPADADAAHAAASDDSSVMSDASVSSAREYINRHVSDPHLEFGTEFTRPRAVRVLEQAIESSLQNSKYDMASKAATTLAFAYGSSDRRNAAAALALAQSCKVTETLLAIFTSAAADQDVESLLIHNYRSTDYAVNDLSASVYAGSLLDRLQSSCRAWSRLRIDSDVSMRTPVELPEDLSVFSLQWIVGRGNEISLAVASHHADANRAGAYVAPADPAQLAAALNIVASYNESFDALQSVCSGAAWSEVCAATEFVLAPVLKALRSFLGADGAKGKKIVLLVDEILSPLPFEAIDVFSTAASVSRDFSLHLLLQRFAESSKLPDVQTADLTYLVDLRDEDSQLSAKFAALQERFGPDWAGVMGTPEGIPGDGECQRLMSGAKALLYFGHGRLLSYITPAAIACVDLSLCRFAILAGNSTCEKERATQMRLDSGKSEELKSLENPYKTAALLSIRGINTIVLPTHACTVERNTLLLESLLSANESQDEDNPPVDICSSLFAADASEAESTEDTIVDSESKEGKDDHLKTEEGPVASRSGRKRNFVVYGFPSVSIVCPPKT